MNIIICGESYTGKSTLADMIREYLIRNIQQDFALVEISKLAGEGARHEKAERVSQIIEELRKLDPKTNRVISGLRQLILLNEIPSTNYNNLIIYVSASEQTVSEFFLSREGPHASDRLTQAQLIDKSLGVKDLRQVSHLQITVTKQNMLLTAAMIGAYIVQTLKELK